MAIKILSYAGIVFGVFYCLMVLLAVSSSSRSVHDDRK